MKPTDREETDGYASRNAIDKLVPERPTDEIVAEMVAREPAKHGVSLDRRKQLAALRALHAGTDNWQAVYEEHCRAFGLNPDEMMGGNKPRYTMGDDGDIKDHETGQIYGAQADAAEAGPDRGTGEAQAPRREMDPAPGAPGLGGGNSGARAEAAHTPDEGREPEPARADSDGDRPGGAAGGDTAGVRAQPCGPDDHVWPELVEASTPCSKCGMTFEAWAIQ